MRVLLTGARGFIGRHTLAALLARGHQVRALDRKPVEDMPSGGMWCDITDMDRLEKVFEASPPFEGIIHLAANASLQMSIEDPIFDASHNIIGTLNLLALAKHYGVKRFVFASTSAVYSRDASLPYRESGWQGGTLSPESPYGVSKAAAEMYIRQWRLPFAILRYGNVYGPGQKAMGENALVARALDHLVHDAPFVVNGDGQQTRDWIYVGDVVDANLVALTSQWSGTFNIATGRQVSVMTVLGHLADAVGVAKKVRWKHGPEKPGELRRVVMHVGHARDVLHWKAGIPLADGLRATAESWQRR